MTTKPSKTTDRLEFTRAEIRYCPRAIRDDKPETDGAFLAINAADGAKVECTDLAPLLRRVCDSFQDDPTKPSWTISWAPWEQLQ